MTHEIAKNGRQKFPVCRFLVVLKFHFLLELKKQTGRNKKMKIERLIDGCKIEIELTSRRTE